VVRSQNETGVTLRRRRSSAVVEDGADLSEVSPDVTHDGTVALGRRFDSEREKEGVRRRSRVAGLTQDRVQALQGL
jgi:hypothetical protein